MTHLMMMTAQPCDAQRLPIVLVVSVRLWRATDTARGGLDVVVSFGRADNGLRLRSDSSASKAPVFRRWEDDKNEFHEA